MKAREKEMKSLQYKLESIKQHADEKDYSDLVQRMDKVCLTCCLKLSQFLVIVMDPDLMIFVLILIESVEGQRVRRPAEPKNAGSTIGKDVRLDEKAQLLVPGRQQPTQTSFTDFRILQGNL